MSQKQKGKSIAKIEKDIAEPVKGKKKIEKKSTPRREGRRRSSYESFHEYVRRVLAERLNSKLAISVTARVMMNSLIDEFIRVVGITVSELLRLHERKTVTSKEISFAVRLLLPDELGKKANAEGVRALQRYEKSAEGGKVSGGKKGSHSKSARAGLLFPVTRVQTHLLRSVSVASGSRRARNGAGAGVFMAAVTEYIISEILELAAKHAMESKRKRIIDRHIALAMKDDAELDQLTHRWVIQGGVKPHIHTFLLPKTKAKSEEE
jgi:histone H2A